MARREDNILTKVRDNILENKLIDNSDVIVLGLSGGPDSVFLLHSLMKLKELFKKNYNIEYKVIVCHVNHMIRKEAKEDENLAKEYAKKYNLEFYPLQTHVKEIAKKQKISEEECGRNIRYEFFNKVLKEHEGTKIAVAHNACDNAETIIHNIIRGTGLNGLVGIKLKNEKIIRPILNIQKDEIIKYLDENGIKYNIDRTNLENDYTRNKIRNDLIKKIEKEYNPNIIQALNRMSYVVEKDLEYINKKAKEYYSKVILYRDDNELKLDIKEFGSEDYAIKNRIVLFAISELIGNINDIEEVHLKQIVNLMDKHISGKMFSIGNKFTIVIEKNKVAKIYKNSVKK